MRLSLDAVRGAILSLLPTGDAFPGDPDTNQARILEPLAALFLAIQHRDVDLLEESDPRTTIELLPDWERAYGLPDGCSALGFGTLGERRAALVAKVTTRGGQTPAIYIGLAEQLGYAITIDEFRGLNCEDFCTDFCREELWHFVWQVNAPETTVRVLDCLGFCTEPLRVWGNEVLECYFERLKPAQTNVLFAYGG